jgi:hypothetical protein
MPAPSEPEALARLQFAAQGPFTRTAGMLWLRAIRSKNASASMIWRVIVQRQWMQMGIWWSKSDRVPVLEDGDALNESLYEIEWPLDETAKKKLK